MVKRSAGILAFRKRPSEVEVLLVHPGGPFWAKKDAGAWSLPKGEYEESEDPLTAAKREFQEETGVRVEGKFLPLGSIQQANGKIVTAWAIEADADLAGMKSNLFSIEWPPKSGKIQRFPEIDRAEWFALPEAKRKIGKGQLGLLEKLAEKLGP